MWNVLYNWIANNYIFYEYKRQYFILSFFRPNSYFKKCFKKETTARNLTLASPHLYHALLQVDQAINQVSVQYFPHSIREASKSSDYILLAGASRINAVVDFEYLPLIRLCHLPIYRILSLNFITIIIIFEGAHASYHP